MPHAHSAQPPTAYPAFRFPPLGMPAAPVTGSEPVRQALARWPANLQAG